MQNNQIVVFPENIDQIILGVTAKYGIPEESQEDAFKKIDEDKTPNLPFIAGISKNYFLKEISDDDLVNLLKENFLMPEDTAKKMAADIKNEVVSTFKLANLQITPEKNIGTNPPALEKKSDMLMPEISEKKSAAAEEQKLAAPLPKKTKLNKETLKITPQINKGNDTYREPIE